MILMKIVPAVPGHFSAYEWLALGIWGLGAIATAHIAATKAETSGELSKPNPNVESLLREE